LPSVVILYYIPLLCQLFTHQKAIQHSVRIPVYCSSARGSAIAADR